MKPKFLMAVSEFFEDMMRSGEGGGKIVVIGRQVFEHKGLKGPVSFHPCDASHGICCLIRTRECSIKII
jgi:hypothetical protein